MTQKEVEQVLCLTGARPIHNLLKRERRKEEKGILKQRGRKPAKTLQEYKVENGVTAFPEALFAKNDYLFANSARLMAAALCICCMVIL